MISLSSSLDLWYTRHQLAHIRKIFDPLQKQVNLFNRGIEAKAYANRRFTELQGNSGRLKAQGVLRTPCAFRNGRMVFGTCGSFRYENAPLAQEVKQILAEEARQRHVHDIRRAIVAGVYDGIRGGIVQSFDKTRFQSIGVSEIRLAILTSLFCSNGKSRSQKHRLGARPQAPLLAPAKCIGEHLRAALHIERANTARPADFMAGNGEQIDPPNRGEAFAAFQMIASHRNEQERSGRVRREQRRFRGREAASRARFERASQK